MSQTVPAALRSSAPNTHGSTSLSPIDDRAAPAADDTRPLLDIMGAIIVVILAGMLAMLVAQRRLKKEIALRIAVEERLKRSNDLLERTGRLAKVGGWELDFVNNRQTRTDEAARIRDLPQGSVATHE